MTDPAPRGTAPGGPSAIDLCVDDARPARETAIDCVRRFLHADIHARLQRQRGVEVSFALGIQASSPEIEAAAARQKAPAQQLIGSYRERIGARLESLGISAGRDGARISTEPAAARELQRLFATLIERDLVYRVGGTWFFRSSRFAEPCERGLDRLPGWSPTAVEAQRRALDRVDGVELTASLLGAGELTIFTTAPELAERTEFIAISPRHPGVESIVGAEAIAALARIRDGVPAVQTALQAALSGVEGLLPVVLTPALDEWARATVSLGVPDQVEAAGSIAGRLRKSAGLPFRAHDRGRKPRPASRYGLTDLAVSRRGAWGTRVPALHCQACGPVPLPEGLAETVAASPCPRCGATAEPDPGVLSPGFEGMWAWSLSGAAAGGRRRVLVSAGDGNRLLHQRIAAAIVDCADLDPGPDGGFATAAAVAGIAAVADDGVGIEELDALTARSGADVVRFALLDAASPGVTAGLFHHSIRYAERFLGELRAYAEPRLGAANVPNAIDPSSRLRRRLGAWCRIGEERMAAALEACDGKRATHQLALLLRRIQDFEERATVEGELDGPDREALAFALARLATIAAPLVPNLAVQLAAPTRAAVGSAAA
jgi:leucyl-tRNA synthetase